MMWDHMPILLKHILEFFGSLKVGYIHVKKLASECQGYKVVRWEKGPKKPMHKITRDI